MAKQQKMKLFELKNNKYTIYHDLDGCLSDLDTVLKKLWNVSEKEFKKLQKTKNIWEPLKEELKKGEKIFENLKKTADCDILWNFVKPLNPIILTSTGGFMHEEVSTQKENWVRKHLGKNVTVVCVPRSSLKAEYADLNSILIDDRDVSIKPWETANGIGILHKNAEDTIKQLKELGINNEK